MLPAGPWIRDAREHLHGFWGSPLLASWGNRRGAAALSTAGEMARSRWPLATSCGRMRAVELSWMGRSCHFRISFA